jgi:hypothetical protein
MNLDSLNKKLALLGGIVALVSALYGGSVWFNNRYVLATEYQKSKTKIELRLDILQLKSLQQDLMRIETEFKGKDMPDIVKQQYASIQEMIRMLEASMIEERKAADKSVGVKK